MAYNNKERNISNLQNFYELCSNKILRKFHEKHITTFILSEHKTYAIFKNSQK